VSIKGMSDQSEALFSNYDNDKYVSKLKPEARWILKYKEAWNDVIIADMEKLDSANKSKVNLVSNSSFLDEDCIYMKKSSFTESKIVDSNGNLLAVCNCDEEEEDTNHLDSRNFSTNWNKTGRVKRLTVKNKDDMTWLTNENFTDLNEENKANHGNLTYLNGIVPGLVGLTNLGNTCFINSGLQCLLSNSQLVSYFTKSYQEQEKIYHFAKNCLSSCFHQLLSKVWSLERTETVLKPSEFKEILGITHPQFQEYRQHDCQEFLALLLGTLHDQLNIAPKRNELTFKDTLRLKMGPKNQEDEENGSLSNHATSQDTGELCPEIVSSPKSSVSISSNSSFSSNSGDIVNEDEHIRSRPLPDCIKSFNINESLKDISNEIISSEKTSNSLKQFTTTMPFNSSYFKSSNFEQKSEHSKINSPMPKKYQEDKSSIELIEYSDDSKHSSGHHLNGANYRLMNRLSQTENQNHMYLVMNEIDSNIN